MAGRVQIRDPQRLEEFRAALGRFRERTLSSLRATEAGIDETARWLDERRGRRDTIPPYTFDGLKLL